MFKLVSFAVLTALALPFAAAAQAQTVRQTMAQASVPAEYPPDSFSGQQFVDSRGCVYLRAGFDGVVNWVIRVDQQRKPICGASPTFGAQPAPVVAAAPVTEVLPVPIAAEPAPAQTPAVASTTTALRAKPVRVAAPRAAKPPVDRVPGVGYEVVASKPGTRKIGCFASAPVAELVRVGGGSAKVVCTRGDGTMTGWREPVYPAGPAVDAAQGNITSRNLPATLIADQSETKNSCPAAVTGRQVNLSTKSSASASVAGGLMVQVGAYGVPANAEGAGARLAALCLPVAKMRYTSGSKALQIVFAGPFGSAAAADQALAAVRRVGFVDAFIR